MATGQKIIDTHNHVWKLQQNENFSWISDDMDRIRRDFFLDDLQKVLVDNQVAGSILVQAIPVIEESEWLMDLADKHEIIKGVIGWCDLSKGSEAVQAAIDRLRRKGAWLKGIRFMSQGLPAKHLLETDFIEGCRTVGENGLIYELLVTAEQLPQTLELVRACPEVTFVIEHIAKPAIKAQKIRFWKENMQNIAQISDKIYCKISGMVTEADWHHWTQKDFEPYMDTVYEAFGQDRIMFGSDWPVSLVGAEYHQVVGIVNEWMAKHTEIDCDKVFYKNATKVYKIADIID